MSKIESADIDHTYNRTHSRWLDGCLQAKGFDELVSLKVKFKEIIMGGTDFFLFFV